MRLPLLPCACSYRINQFERIKLIARPILKGCNIPTTCWGHVVLHAADLIQLRPTAYHTASPLQMVRGNPPRISHLWKFGCAVSLPISPPKWTSMGPHRKLGSMWDIYIPIDHKNTQSPLQGICSQLGLLIVSSMKIISWL